MGITVSHQSPTVLEAWHTIPADGTYDPVGAVRATLVEPILGSTSGGSSVTLTGSDGTDVTDQLEPLLLDCLTGRIDQDAEKATKEVLGQTLQHFEPDTAIPVEELFALQAGARLGLPVPAERVLYTPGSDVIPAAKQVQTGTGDPDALFVSLAHTYHPNTLGFWFRDEQAFTAFGQWLRSQAQSTGLPALTKKLLRDVADLPMDRLTQGLILRKDEHNGNAENSFARVVVHLLMRWVEQQRSGSDPTSGLLPFTLSQLFIPTSVVLVNAAAHAEASPSRVGKEWRIINQGLGSRLRVIPHDQLAKLDALPRAAARAQVEAYQQPAPGEPGSRSTRLRLRKQPPPQIELASDMAAVIKTMGKVNYSQNVLLTSKPSMRRANRRDPDDPNRPGRVTAKQYLPDLHAYLDFSMSMDEGNSQEAVMTMIVAAKKMGVNFYVNSFSHVLSEETLLRTKGRSPARVWKEFSAVPKVSGGTDFEQIWRYVNASASRRQRLSVVITDFGYTPPAVRVDHPSRLFYAPCGRKDWDQILHYAKEFVADMGHIEPAVGTRLLGMYD